MHVFSSLTYSQVFPGFSLGSITHSFLEEPLYTDLVSPASAHSSGHGVALILVTGSSWLHGSLNAHLPVLNEMKLEIVKYPQRTVVFQPRKCES
jgi:hypothetical protein